MAPSGPGNPRLAKNGSTRDQVRNTQAAEQTQKHENTKRCISYLKNKPFSASITKHKRRTPNIATNEAQNSGHNGNSHESE